VCAYRDRGCGKGASIRCFCGVNCGREVRIIADGLSGILLADAVCGAEPRPHRACLSRYAGQKKGRKTRRRGCLTGVRPDNSPSPYVRSSELKEENGQSYYLSERSLGSFERSIWLPDTVDDAKVDRRRLNGLVSNQSLQG